ncbi:glycosyltransferase [Pectinatus cerevisiiphilus]|uniref:Glycosyl transferase family 2 n=1 Tax=Pectinatus cerevisiiphilus TaxID=86956 RepID=A0A4R3K238_9FIRM|nr:glycosyltransferase [Pectinatus cerevisiiphilus]TCS76029.1 glycosyl transferase family 2 [Pectinatus cerevisiiphilus]
MCNLVTILVPCYNEEAVLGQFYKRTTQVLSTLKEHFEILFINDGSNDHTLNIIKNFHKNDSRVSYIDLSRNFGKEIAMLAGIDFSHGDPCVLA